MTRWCEGTATGPAPTRRWARATGSSPWVGPMESMIPPAISLFLSARQSLTNQDSFAYREHLARKRYLPAAPRRRFERWAALGYEIPAQLSAERGDGDVVRQGRAGRAGHSTAMVGPGAGKNAP